MADLDDQRIDKINKKKKKKKKKLISSNTSFVIQLL